ncbi:MAG: hypothetical protein V4487_03820 [Chlamydiota bacterium]
MLEFFRKYQRMIFIFVTVMVIASFTFFGTYSAFDSGEVEKKDRTVTLGIDGSKIQLSQLALLSRFLSSDREDHLARDFTSNWFNDGVVRHDFLETGLADLLVSDYFEPLKSGLQTRLDAAKRFRPYIHPQAPFLSAKSVWGHFSPLLNQEMEALQAEASAIPAVFAHLSRLYQQQSHFQPEFLRRILTYQQQQYPMLAKDERLYYEDLSLFGFHSLNDWFGGDFLDLVSQFILNAAIAAEEKGYRVSFDEAKGSLLHNFEQAMQKQEKNKERAPTFSQALRMVGFDEKSAVETWQKVLLFRALFQDVGQSTFTDQLGHRDFAGYALQTAVVEKYSWPEPFHFKNFDELTYFQVYLKAVFQPEKDPLAMPTKVLPLNEVEKKFPELVSTKMKAHVAEVFKNQIALRASMREVWEWELEEKNWNRLKKEFPELPKGASRDERFQALENFKGSRPILDAFVRNVLVEENPDWIRDALEKAAKVEKVLSFSAGTVDLGHIENGRQFKALIDSALNGDPEALASLLQYSDDGKSYYRLEGLEKKDEPAILTFKEARKVLPQLTDRLFEAEYPKIRLKFPQKFQNAEGEWRPFGEVKEQVALQLFEGLFKAMDSLAPAKSEKPSPLFYAKNRLLAPAREALAALEKNPTDLKWTASNSDPLLDQFKLEQKEESIQRSSKEVWMKEQAFLLVPNQWSPIHVAEEGQIVFFYLKEKKPCSTPLLDQMSVGKETLAADAKRYLAERLLETAKGKKSIVIPVERVVE